MVELSYTQMVRREKTSVHQSHGCQVALGCGRYWPFHDTYSYIDVIYKKLMEESCGNTLFIKIWRLVRHRGKFASKASRLLYYVSKATRKNHESRL